MKDAVRQLLIGTTTFIVMLILLAVGTKFDYDIAVAMYAPGNFFSIIMSALAKMPAFFLMGASCAILVKCAKNKTCNIVLKRTYFVIYTLLGVVSVSFGFLDTFQLIFDKIAYQYVLSTLCGIVLYVLFMLDLSKYRDLEFERYKKWAFTTCIAVGIIAVSTYGMKFLFGRLNYGQIHEGLGEFCAWYKLQHAEGGWAMPDNQTALACAVFMMMPLTKIHSKMTNKSFWFVLSGLVFIILVMLGGMFNGSYFLSDVALGGIIGYLVTKISVTLAFGPDGTRIALSEKNILNKL